MDDKLCWDDHINLVCSRVYFILRSLWRVASNLPPHTKRRLILSFVFPHFIYGDIVLFDMSARCKDRFQLWFNACTRFMFGLRKYDHISDFSNEILGCNLTIYSEFRLCLFLQNLLKSRTPTYLYEKVILSRNFEENRKLIIPSNKFTCFNSSFFVKGIMLWNRLPLEIKKTNSRGTFLEKFLEWRNSSDFVYF